MFESFVLFGFIVIYLLLRRARNRLHLVWRRDQNQTPVGHYDIPVE